MKTGELVDFEYWFVAKVISNHDGDTVTLDIDLGVRIRKTDAVRLHRINAPELSQPGGKEAREFLRNILPPGTIVHVQTFKNVEDKYGRWLAAIWKSAGNLQNPEEFVCINDLMVEAKHATYRDY